MKNVAYEASDRCRVNNRFANAPVGIRTRAPGSTGRDHRPLDHRGSGRRKVRSLIILSYETGEHRFLGISPTDSRFLRLDEHATGRALEALFPFIRAKSFG